MDELGFPVTSRHCFSGDPMDQSTCSVRPPSSYTKCIFPFKYLGKTYTACTFDDDTEAWCATKLDLLGNMVEGSKARCGDDCSITQPATSRLIIFQLLYCSTIMVSDDPSSVQERVIPYRPHLEVSLLLSR